MNRIHGSWLAWLLATLPAAVLAAAPADPLGKASSWKAPDVEDVKTQALAWLEKAKADEATRLKASDLWAKLPKQPSGGDLLQGLAETFALADPLAAELVKLCSRPRRAANLPDQAWLADAKTPPLVSANLRLFYARWLVQNALYDEALEQLNKLQPGDVAAPAELLFYQGVANYRLLHKAPGLKVLEQLLDGADASPRRFVVLARLMQADLAGLDPEKLDHIARQMQDVQRRLELGRAGPKVRKVEDDVIKALDKLIKKAEEEQQRQQQQQQASQGNNRSNSPAPDSRVLGGKGAGEVTRKNIGSKSGWGDLPPKEREEALQQIGRDFPAHYRDVIEQYFRRQAAEENRENR